MMTAGEVAEAICASTVTAEHRSDDRRAYPAGKEATEEKTEKK